ncbi:unnamed protein product [Paramecium primaurelia]|uniref:Uncharacterized protein n=1 Tax=Paramecium primaurelia TaxID=5886 RepID=A0A8S1MBD3_PARPR|nr:unnamed protein product [Paramecium primaurelia]CAD8075041.1 unnamed protein product [Paramecium primaurelia]CAD8075045.1 unnamed protein product [Paramecium primaurelia]
MSSGQNQISEGFIKMQHLNQMEQFFQMQGRFQLLEALQILVLQKILYKSMGKILIFIHELQWIYNLHNFMRLIEQKSGTMILNIEYSVLKQLQLYKIILKRNCIQGIIKKVWQRQNLKINLYKKQKQFIWAAHMVIQLFQKSKLHMQQRIYFEKLIQN